MAVYAIFSFFGGVGGAVQSRMAHCGEPEGGPSTTINRSPRFVGAIALALLLAACVTQRMEAPGGDVTATPFGAVALFQNNAPITDGTPIAGADQNLNILVLSGGGSHGAFGAGILNGWSESGKRPEFDIVTGVSTGALMAVPAYLGPEYDALLRRVYTTSHDTDIYRRRGVAGFFLSGLNDSSPLAAQIAAIVDDHVLAAVAEEYQDGRLLFVATTNLDAGELVVWDMGKIAASNHPEKLKLFRTVLLASASIPGFFEPVFISTTGAIDERTGQMHVDGGVKAPILLRSWMLNGEARSKNVFVVMNGNMRLATEAGPVEDRFMSISSRSIGELLRGLTYKTLYQAYVTTQQAGAQFRVTFVPDDEEDMPATSFDPEEMAGLFEVGRAIGAMGHSSWPDEPPRLEPLERL